MPEPKKFFSFLNLGKNTSLPNNSLKQHLKRRLIVITPLALIMFFMMHYGFLDKIMLRAHDKMTFNNELSWFDNNALDEHLRVALMKNHLNGHFPQKCLVLLFNGDASVNLLDIVVMGRYGNGCPMTEGKNTALAEPLFHFKINRALKQVQTDAGSPGLFHPIPL